jgi:UDP-glucose 4-epimerase
MGYHIFIDAILRGKPVTLYGDGTQSRGNTYVTDAVAANLAAMAHGPTDEAFNIGGGEEITANDLIVRLETLIGLKAAIHRAPARPGEQVRTLADISKARRVLGWSPTVGLDTGLAKQVEWQRSQLTD